MGTAILILLAAVLGALAGAASAYAGRDPDLEQGFPARAYRGAGTYIAGPIVHTLVGNIDEDPELETLVTGTAVGPLGAWKADGTPVPGWPETDTDSVVYPVLANLSDKFPGYEVFNGTVGRWSPSRIQSHAGDGTLLTGWPQDGQNYASTAPSAGDVDGDGLDEVFMPGHDSAYI